MSWFGCWRLVFAIRKSSDSKAKLLLPSTGQLGYLLRLLEWGGQRWSGSSSANSGICRKIFAWIDFAFYFRSL
jgi:hypothetical protein